MNKRLLRPVCSDSQFAFSWAGKKQSGSDFQFAFARPGKKQFGSQMSNCFLHPGRNNSEQVMLELISLAPYPLGHGSLILACKSETISFFPSLGKSKLGAKLLFPGPICFFPGREKQSEV